MRVELVDRSTHVDAVLESCRATRSGALLVGQAGIGKTRLLEEVLARLSEDGWYAMRCVAAHATSTVPFGPLLSLLPAIGDDRTELHAAIREELRHRAGGRPTVVGIDDAHLLDAASLACIIDLVHHSHVAVVLTARSDGAPCPELTRLWSSGALVRVDVDPLGPDECIALAELLLEARVAPDLADRLVGLAGGVPLLLRELVLDARGMGAVERCNGTWYQVGPLRSGARLQELVAARISQLDPIAAEVFDLVTLGEPLRIGLLEPLELEALDGLERQRLVVVQRCEAGWSAHVDHPLLGEASRAAMPTRRRVELLRDLAARTVAAGCACRGDALRVARWATEAGDQLDPALAVTAGREALVALDLDRAAELALGALEDLPFQGHLLLGEVRRLAGRAVDAEHSLSIAAALASSDDDIVRIAMWRSTLLAHHMGEPAAAVRLLEESAGRVGDPNRALELTSEASFLAGILGRFDDAARTNRTILSRPALDDDTTWTARINLIYAQAMLARLDGVDEHVKAAQAMAEHIGRVRPEGVDLLWALRAGIAVQRGDLIRGEREILDHVARCERQGTSFGLTGAILQQLLLLRGSSVLLDQASRTIRDLDASDPYAVRPIALACTALSQAAVGDRKAARRLVDAIPESALDDVRALAFVRRAQAGVIARDDLDQAARLVTTSGRDSIERLHVSFGLLALYDAVLLGRSALVVGDLEATAAETCAAPLFAAMAAHARAQHMGEPEALEAVATRFASIGARPLAAHAFADAAWAHTGSVAARRAAARALMWAMGSAPMAPPRVAVQDSVTGRELEVAIEAAAGRPSRQIAQRFYLSVRTVDNHLTRVYAKLGVSGRDELPRVLGPPPR